LQNRYKVTTTALANTRANAFALLDTKCAKKISKFFNILLKTLKRPVLVKGYNKQIRKPITLTLHIYLQINKQ
jgi:hypothetical protein